MRNRFLVLSLSSLVLMAAAAVTAASAWALLGERTVTDRLDHDTIVVTGARGEFSAIKIAVKKRAVDFHRVVVHFGNGEQQEIELRHTIPAGDETRTIDFAGGRRVITSVDLWYDAHTLRGKRALIRAFGLR